PESSRWFLVAIFSVFGLTVRALAPSVKHHLDEVILIPRLFCLSLVNGKVSLTIFSGRRVRDRSAMENNFLLQFVLGQRVRAGVRCHTSERLQCSVVGR